VSETAPDKTKPAESQHSTTKHKRKKPRQSPGGFGKFIIALVVLGLLGAVFWRYGLKSWHDYRARVTGLEAVVQALQEAQTREQADLDERLSAIAKKQTHLEEGVSQFLEQNGHVRKDWLLAEAEYLIKLAGHRLLLERDVQTAIVALESANKRLGEMGDPGVIKVRKQVTKDIQTLKKIPVQDISGISLTLSTLEQDVSKLPLRTPDPKDIQRRVDAQSPESRHASSISEFAELVWADIKSLVVVRQHDEAVQHLLQPEQRFFLIQNLQLKLEQARLALLQSEYQIYQERLQETQKWIKKYFDSSHSSTRAMQDTLKSLLKQKFQFDLPELSHSFRAVEQYRLDSSSTRNKKNKSIEKKIIEKPAPEKQQKQDKESVSPDQVNL